MKCKVVGAVFGRQRSILNLQIFSAVTEQPRSRRQTRRLFGGPAAEFSSKNERRKVFAGCPWLCGSCETAGVQQRLRGFQRTVFPAAFSPRAVEYYPGRTPAASLLRGSAVEPHQRENYLPKTAPTSNNFALQEETTVRNAWVCLTLLIGS